MVTSPAQERNVELARGGLESWMKGDVEATLATFTDDVETYVPAELGNAGRFHGKEEFLEWTSHWVDATVSATSSPCRRTRRTPSSSSGSARRATPSRCST